MADNFLSLDEAEEAFERNRKIAMEVPMEMKRAETIASTNKEVKETKIDERDIWNYIFFLTDEIKRLKGELDAK